LTELVAGHVSAPVWSPDGAKVTVTIGTNMTPSYTLLFDAGGDSDQVAETLYTSPSNETFEPNSWSRGGARLAGDIRLGAQGRSGIAMLTVENGELRKLTDFGTRPVWLRDGRRLLFQWGGRIYLLDTRSPEPREVFSSSPDVLTDAFAVSSDDRWIYLSLERREADVWRLQR
jgi:Tol biopolymer transport system component